MLPVIARNVSAVVIGNKICHRTVKKSEYLKISTMNFDKIFSDIWILITQTRLQNSNLKRARFRKNWGGGGNLDRHS